MSTPTHGGLTTAAPTDDGHRMNGWRLAAWGGAALLLLLPLVAMLFTDEVAWTGSDFVFAAVLILGVGLPFELAVRRTLSPAYRAGAGVALAAAFLLVWVNAAVGINDAVDVVYLGVPAVGLLGALAARFRPAGMARAMAATAAAQVAIGAVSLAAGWVAPHNPAVLILGVNGVFAALWLASALLFRNAARDGRAAWPAGAASL